MSEPTAEEIEAEVDAVMAFIDRSGLTGTAVSRRTTLDFYEGIVSLLEDRITVIEEELEAENGVGPAS